MNSPARRNLAPAPPRTVYENYSRERRTVSKPSLGVQTIPVSDVKGEHGSLAVALGARRYSLAAPASTARMSPFPAPCRPFDDRALSFSPSFPA